jgi:membrane associated rhomboid family serine protease
MSSGPDLSLVCKSCGAEVSPYITECPYCGARVQKRAPKLDRGGVPRTSRSRRSRPQLPRLRPGEIPGIRADRRPWATGLLVLATVAVTVGIKSGVLNLLDFWYGPPGATEPWRAFTSLFAYTHTAYEIAVVGAVALFGWLLERRHGPWAPLLVFFAAGAGGAYADIQLANDSVVLGANGAALGLLAAWAMRDVLGRRAGRPDDSDLLGALAIAALLVLLPLASKEAGGVAGLVGGGIGIVFGLLLARLPER